MNLLQPFEDLLDAYPRGCDGLGCSGWDDLAADARSALTRLKEGPLSVDRTELVDALAGVENLSNPGAVADAILAAKVLPVVRRAALSEAWREVWIHRFDAKDERYRGPDSLYAGTVRAANNIAVLRDAAREVVGHCPEHHLTYCEECGWVNRADTSLTWPCDNYKAPHTCLTAPSSEAVRCDFCREQAAAVPATVYYEVHHHDVERHAESHNEGYDAAMGHVEPELEALDRVRALCDKQRVLRSEVVSVSEVRTAAEVPDDA